MDANEPEIIDLDDEDDHGLNLPPIPPQAPAELLLPPRQSPPSRSPQRNPPPRSPHRNPPQRSPPRNLAQRYNPYNRPQVPRPDPSFQNLFRTPAWRPQSDDCESVVVDAVINHAPRPKRPPSPVLISPVGRSRTPSPRRHRQRSRSPSRHRSPPGHRYSPPPRHHRDPRPPRHYDGRHYESHPPRYYQDQSLPRHHREQGRPSHGPDPYRHLGASPPPPPNFLAPANPENRHYPPTSRRITPTLIPPFNHRNYPPPPSTATNNVIVNKESVGVPAAENVKTVEVSIQTGDIAKDKDDIKESSPACSKCSCSSSASTPKNEPSSKKSQLEILIGKMTTKIQDNINHRIRRTFDINKTEEEKKVESALEKALEGIKADRSSTREIMELLHVIDPRHFVDEVDRLWRKDRERAKELEKEDALAALCKELQGIEKNLTSLYKKFQDQTITQLEREQYPEVARQLALKYENYQKYVKTGCPIRARMYKHQVQPFDLKKATVYAEVNQAVASFLNQERADFLMCTTDVESIYTPLFETIKEKTEEALAKNWVTLDADEVYRIASKVYKAAVQQIQNRRYDDLWESLLSQAGCPSMETLKKSDPAGFDPNLTWQLIRNARIGQEKLSEFLKAFTDTEMQTESDTDGVPSDESSFNLDDILNAGDNIETEEDRSFVQNDTDAIVPTQTVGVGSFTAIVQEMEQIHSSDAAAVTGPSNYANRLRFAEETGEK